MRPHPAERSETIRLLLCVFVLLPLAITGRGGASPRGSPGDRCKSSFSGIGLVPVGLLRRVGPAVNVSRRFYDGIGPSISSG